MVKLHTKLGKPIPSTEPSVVTQTPTSTTAAPSKTPASSSSTLTGSTSNSSYLKSVNVVSQGGAGIGKGPTVNSLSAANATTAVKKVNTPKINFVGKKGLSCFYISVRYQFFFLKICIYLYLEVLKDFDRIL